MMPCETSCQTCKSNGTASIDTTGEVLRRRLPAAIAAQDDGSVRKGVAAVMRHGVGALLLVTAVWSMSLSLVAQEATRFAFSHPQMGTTFSIVLYAPDSLTARRAAEAAFARIDSLNAHLSDYVPQSELNRLSASAGSGQWMPVEDDLWTVLVAARSVSEASGGAFDVTIGPLSRLWRRAIRRAEPPDPAALEDARSRVGFRHVEMDPATRRVRLDRPGMRLDLGGIAKGYAVDEALEVLRAHGIEAALVDGGGDIALGAPPPGAEGWQIAAATVDSLGEQTETTLVVAHTAVATSGDAYRYVELDGIRYSHIVDPRTGIGLTDRALVTVMAPTGMEADALASAVSVLGPEDGLALVATRPGVEARIIRPDGARLLVLETPGFEE